MRRSKIDIELLRYLQGELTSKSELAEVNDWISCDENNRAYFMQFKKLWEEKQFVEQLKAIDVYRIRAGLQEKIEERQSPPEDVSLGLRYRSIGRVAAMILMLLLPSTVLYILKTRPANSIQKVSSMLINTELILSDGSLIELNKGSTLCYPEKLKRGKREVELSGEAFFEVASMKNSPFFVHVGSSTVQVLGTSFNLKEEEEKIIVHVLSGEVLFYESGKKKDALRLEKGSEAVYHTQSGIFEQGTFERENFLFWRTGMLIFQDEPLSQVFRELSHHFSTPIVTDDQAILLDRLTTSCEGQQLREILNELSFLHDLYYDFRNDTVYVKRKSP